MDKKILDLAALYKKDVAKKFIALDPSQIDERLAGSVFYVSRKYDGELALLLWDGKECLTVNTGGKQRTGFPCLEEAAKLLKSAKIKSAVIAAELYKNEEKGRTRVTDTLAALAKDTLHGELRLAFFDIVSIDGEQYKSGSYKETYEKISVICAKSTLVHPVRCETVNSKEKVKELFAKWVDEEGGEGLVVRSELPMVYKIKNRHTLDTVIVGFSEGTGSTKEMVRTFLLALMGEDGNYQVIGKCPAAAIDEPERKSLCAKLLKMKIKSDYTEIDSNNLAFHMIKPEIVAEVSFNDLIFENQDGPVFDPCLELKNNEYHCEKNVYGINMISPVFVRFREDKKAVKEDVRYSQLNDLICTPYEDDKKQKGDLPKSQLLQRDVYKKTQGEKLMVQKFLVWKTNKDGLSGVDYPAFVLSYTNYSSDRADSLQYEVRVSDNKKQIMELHAAFVDKNVKKGWEKVS
jgi:ATP-dependent DNA ligase